MCINALFNPMFTYTHLHYNCNTYIIIVMLYQQQFWQNQTFLFGF